MAPTARLVGCEPTGPGLLPAMVEGAGFAVEALDPTDHGWQVVVARPAPA